MSSDQLGQLRNTCLTAIRQCEQAEKTAKQVQDAAAHNRQAELSNARLKDTQTRQQVEKTLEEIHTMVNQADRILKELKLTPGSIAPLSPLPGGKLDDMLKSLANQRGQAHISFSQLQNATKALKDERKKWWKFW